MKVELTYDEIVNYVAQHFHIQLKLASMDEKTIGIECKPVSFVPAMSIRAHIDECQNNVLAISYECSIPMAAIISGAIGHMGNLIPDGIEVNPSSKRVVLNLEQMDMLKKPLEFVDVEVVSFYDDHAAVSLRLK